MDIEQGGQRRWQGQTISACKAAGGVHFDPRLQRGQVRGRVRKVKVHSWHSEGANRIQMLERNNET